MAEEKTFSAKQVATRIGTDARQLRKFFRDSESGYDAVGQGGRYDFPESQLPEIKAKFDAWAATKTRRNRVKAPIVRGGAPHVMPLPRPRSAERAVNRPAPRLLLSREQIARLDEDGRQMLRAVGIPEEGFEPDYEGDGYVTSYPHNETQSIVDAMERYGDDEPRDFDSEDIDLMGDYDPED